MSAQFTPGPWQRSGVRQKIDGQQAHGVFSTADGKDVCVASVWYDPVTHEGFADANLIAAAHEMYDALRAARDAVEGHFDDNCDVCREAIDMIRAALAKAEGQ